ncbi:MAG: hypothetical protein ACMZI0_09705 [Symbiopectobacterium sp.]|uniref:hypothetical protein n=1 Tax=Symbiopectobacterium sp. TaxID=2952789 RepID=UPI0039EA43B9
MNRNAQGRWEIDPSFIPPLLAFSAAPMLVAQTEKLLSSSRMKRRPACWRCVMNNEDTIGDLISRCFGC